MKTIKWIVGAISAFSIFIGGDSFADDCLEAPGNRLNHICQNQRTEELMKSTYCE